MKRIHILCCLVVFVYPLAAQIDMQAHVASDEGKSAYSKYKTMQDAYYTGNCAYSNTYTKDGSELFGILTNKMSSTIRLSENGFNYNSLRYEYANVDRDLNFSDKIIGYYDGMSLPSNWDGNNNYNREHTWPQSKGADKTRCMGYDMQSVRPCNVKVNSDRGNTPYGESSSYYDPDDIKISNSYYKASNKGTYHGDCARVILYDFLVYGEYGGQKGTMYNGYAQLLSKLGSSGVFESVAILLKWHMQDPPSLTEMVRNDGGEEYQGNRNPFIDYPELAVQMLKNEINTYSVTSNMIVQPAYRMTTADGFVAYLTKPDGTHPQNISVSGATADYEANLGRLTVTKVTGDVSITTDEITSLDNFSQIAEYHVAGNSLRVNLFQPADVSVYSLTGILMGGDYNHYGEFSINLPSGIYILRINSHSIKIHITRKP